MRKAVGHDNIPAFFLKTATLTIAPYLLVLTDYAFSSGIYPDSCKIAKVIPLHKKGDVNNPNNYRPISILTCFSKIFEKILHKRLTKFLNKNNVLIPSQYGFQSKFSTSHAILDIVTQSFDNIKINHYTGLFFVDLKKAFDTVSHQILLDKLEHYGIRGTTLKLLTSFLQRKQFVSINGTYSEVKTNPYGVPQGSTLGPLLFLVYINDLPNAIKTTPRLFADDTCILVNDQSLFDLQDKLNYELINLSKWCKANKLTINPTKCDLLIIPPKLNENTPKVCILIDNIPIESKENVRYLGVLIDSKLSYHPHIKALELKLSRALGILNKLKQVLPQDILLKLYYALIHPNLLYGLIAWGSTYPTYLNKLNTLQNKAVKLVGGGTFYDRATPYYLKLNIPKLEDMYKLDIAKLTYNFIHRPTHLPKILNSFFEKACNVSQRNTRSSSNHDDLLYIPRFRSNKLQRSIKYQGVKVWNSIPPDIRASSPQSFASKLKNFFLQSYTQ